MKTYVKQIILLSTLLTAVTSPARSLMPHRPYRTAEMTVTKATGDYSKEDSVTLSEWTYPAQVPTALTRVGNLLVLEVNGKESGLMVNSVEDGGCGSKLILASSYSQGPQRKVSDQMTIELIDHTTRICKDIQPNKWVAVVTLIPHSIHRPASILHIQGNPRHVIQDQVLSAPLNKYLVDPKVWFAKSKLGEATITVDLKKQLVTLFIEREYYCPPNRMCPAVMPPPVVVSLPITGVVSGPCGTTIYEASEDKRPVDGAFQMLTVEDNREFYKNCKSPLAVPGVKVTYDTKALDMRNGKEFTSHSQFLGSYLMPLNQ